MIYFLEYNQTHIWNEMACTLFVLQDREGGVTFQDKPGDQKFFFINFFFSMGLSIHINLVALDTKKQ